MPGRGRPHVPTVPGTPGDIVRKSRERLGLTQAALGSKSGYTRFFTSAVELGKAGGSPESREAIANALSMRVDEIWPIQDTPGPSATRTFGHNAALSEGISQTSRYLTLAFNSPHQTEVHIVVNGPAKEIRISIQTLITSNSIAREDALANETNVPDPPQ